MADTYPIQMPAITAATLSPNPVLQNASYTISVTITERTVVLEPYNYLSGELYSGEV